MTLRTCTPHALFSNRSASITRDGLFCLRVSRAPSASSWASLAIRDVASMTLSAMSLATVMSIFISVKTNLSSTQTIALFQALDTWLLSSSKAISSCANPSILSSSRPSPPCPALPESVFPACHQKPTLLCVPMSL